MFENNNMTKDKQEFWFGILLMVGFGVIIAFVLVTAGQSDRQHARDKFVLDSLKLEIRTQQEAHGSSEGL